ncbi:hypothetical protein OYC64_007518 [Pagothenia borchgrevinki]|uniref:Uncharacterized protein n=1 Tax=Pagothenia borchgrevinki TaxID=8213 RepID=A0ABD2GTV1_PAGBO
MYNKNVLVPPSIHLLQGALSSAARWRAFQWWPTRMMMISLWGNLKLSRGNVCVAVPLQTERFGGTDRSVLVLQDSAVETLPPPENPSSPW